MTATMEHPYLRAYEAFTAARAADPDWLRELRRQAFERFERLGLPVARDEAWKYTNPAPLGAPDLVLAPPAPALDAATLEALAGVDLGPNRLVFVDGAFAPALSRLGALPAGAFVGSIAAAAATQGERIRRVIYDRIGDERHAFAALNTAFTGDGAFIYVPRGAAVAEPVHVVFAATAPGTALLYARLIVLAEEGAAVTVVEHHAGDGAAVSNALTEIEAEANAEVRHVQLQRLGRAARFVATLDAAVARDARLHAWAFSYGAALARNDYDVALAGEGAEVSLQGLQLAAGDQHVDYHTTIIHARPHGRSRERFKAIAAGKSTAVFNGRVVVPIDSQKTDSEQASHNLLLSRDATVNAKPQLEIYADDVKCAHGTTVGQLDEQAVFYLRARGLAEVDARAMLTHAFAAEIIEGLPVPALREALNEWTSAWFPAASETNSKP